MADGYGLEWMGCDMMENLVVNVALWLFYNRISQHL